MPCPSWALLQAGTTSMAAYLKLHPAIDGIDGLPWHEVGGSTGGRGCDWSSQGMAWSAQPCGACWSQGRGRG